MNHVKTRVIILSLLLAGLTMGGEHMKDLTAYLMFSGDCRQALQFYADCLDGEITRIQTVGESPLASQVPDEFKDRVFDAHFVADGIRFQASDDQPGNPVSKGTNFALLVRFDTLGEFERAYQCLQQGGQVIMPFDESQEGPKFAMVADSFGIQWMLTNN